MLEHLNAVGYLKDFDKEIPGTKWSQVVMFPYAARAPATPCWNKIVNYLVKDLQLRVIFVNYGLTWCIASHAMIINLAKCISILSTGLKITC